MEGLRPVGGLFCMTLAAALALIATGAVHGWTGRAQAAEPRFPFDQELLFETAPIPPAKRKPSITVSTRGMATLDLWCKSVTGQVELSDVAIRIMPGPLPEAMPQFMSPGQCTPQRMAADESFLASLAAVSGWQRRGEAVVLTGSGTPLKFYLSTH
jgi:hypothetical protein